MRLLLAYASTTTLELLRYPAYVVPTLLFPAMFFLFFAAAASGRTAAVAVCTFAGFAAIGVAFFQFGVGIAGERASPWEMYLRTLPAPAWTRVGARVFSASLFAAASAAAVVAAGLATTDAALPAARWAQLAAVLALGIVPFALLGTALGYWTSPRAALPLANVLYLGLAYAGGLWIRPARLPPAVRAVSPFLPTRRLGDALAAVAAGSPWQWRDWLLLAGFTLGFGALALAGYRRDEGQRFR